MNDREGSATFIRLGAASPRPISRAWLAHARALLEPYVEKIEVAEVPASGFSAVSLTGWAAEVPTRDGELSDTLKTTGIAVGVDCLLTTGQMAQRGPALIVTDVDSTFIQQEVIELVAAHAGTEDEVRRITSEAMRGNMDFAESLALRVGTLAGLPVDVLNDVRTSVTLTPGADHLVKLAHRNGAKVGLVSGGFDEVLSPIAAAAGIDMWIANQFEVEDGRLTGRTEGDIVDAQAKVRTVREWADQLGIDPALVLCVGDGANDLPMLAQFGAGVAFCAKPIVREQADATISFQRLDAVAALCGWAAEEG